MPVEEGNRLIAEFMGRKFKPYKDNHSYDAEYNTYAECLSAIEENKWMGYTPQLGWKIGVGKYHSSWDWLMPVVEKIEKMDSRDVDCRISIEKDTCNIYYDDKEKQYEFNLWADGSKIKAVWQSIVAFLQWYNTQTSKQ